MTDGPRWEDAGEKRESVRPVKRRYAMWYEMVHDEDGGSVVAQFMDKTLADGTANRWNADFGKTIYRIRKIR
jgi:hypothetical protein